MEARRDPRLVKGIEEFNQGLYFECHETLEEIWLEERGEDRAFYQGIIQIAAGYFKWEQGVAAGTVKLLRAGLEKLGRYDSPHLGIDLGAFVAGVKKDLKEIEDARQGGEGPPSLSPPPLSFHP